MNIETRMEVFSYAYVYALASQAGFAFKEETKGNDNVGIDISVNDPLRMYDFPPCRFSGQVKCVRKTKLGTDRSGNIFYKIKKKYYDSLTKSRPCNTILLFILVVPENIDEWIVSDESSIIVSHELYWFCLQSQPLSMLGHPDSKEKIILGNENLLTPASFPSLMQKIADGEI